MTPISLHVGNKKLGKQRRWSKRDHNVPKAMWKSGMYMPR